MTYLESILFILLFVLIVCMALVILYIVHLLERSKTVIANAYVMEGSTQPNMAIGYGYEPPVYLYIKLTNGTTWNVGQVNEVEIVPTIPGKDEK